MSTPASPTTEIALTANDIAAAELASIHDMMTEHVSELPEELQAVRGEILAIVATVTEWLPATGPISEGLAREARAKANERAVAAMKALHDLEHSLRFINEAVLARSKSTTH